MFYLNTWKHGLTVMLFIYFYLLIYYYIFLKQIKKYIYICTSCEFSVNIKHILASITNNEIVANKINSLF